MEISTEVSGFNILNTSVVTSPENMIGLLSTTHSVLASEHDHITYLQNKLQF